jgi:putative glutamine amidotransferase
MRRPVIGICTALERASWSVWDQEAMLLPRSYVDAVQRAGGLPVLLAPDPALVREPQQALELIDGLMLAGGADIDPGAYGAEAHAETNDTVPERDAFEIALARAAIAADLPVLGICRGMQLINVACGGTLLQHLPERFGHHEHRRVLGSFDGADHDVALRAGSLAAGAAGEVAHPTKSHHHQGVDCLGAGLVVSGNSALDELPEAVELPGHRFVLGVQWHPEADPDSNVIPAFVAAARMAAIYCAASAAAEGDESDRLGDRRRGGRRAAAAQAGRSPADDAGHRLLGPGRAVRRGAPLAAPRRGGERAADVGLRGRLQDPAR